MDAIADAWGLNERRLHLAIGIPRSTARHHLRLLEDSGLVKRLALGRERHYFPPCARLDQMESLARAHQGRRWEILQAVLTAPGIRQCDLARRFAMTRKILRSNLDALQAAGLIAEIRQGNWRRYVATATAAAAPDRTGAHHFHATPAEAAEAAHVARTASSTTHPLRPG